MASSAGVAAFDYVVFTTLTVISLGTGIYLSVRRRGRLRNKYEAFLGNRDIHPIPLAFSMLESSVTAFGQVAFVAHYYVYGFRTMWQIPTFLPLEFFIVYQLLPLLYKLNITSIFEGSWS